MTGEYMYVNYRLVEVSTKGVTTGVNHMVTVQCVICNELSSGYSRVDGNTAYEYAQWNHAQHVCGEMR